MGPSKSRRWELEDFFAEKDETKKRLAGLTDKPLGHAFVVKELGNMMDVTAMEEIKADE